MYIVYYIFLACTTVCRDAHGTGVCWGGWEIRWDNWEQKYTYTHTLSHTLRRRSSLRAGGGTAVSQQQFWNALCPLPHPQLIILSIPRYRSLPTPGLRWWKKSQMCRCMCKGHLSYLQTAMAQASPYLHVRLHSLGCSHPQYMINIPRSSPTS